VNKKKQKNFDFFDVATAGVTQVLRGAKVFWFFFSKKNSLFLLTFLNFGRLGSYLFFKKERLASSVDAPPTHCHKPIIAMPAPLLISLPVHERPDIAAGQVANIRQAAPNSLVCLHVSPEFTGDMADFLALESRPGIFINPQRLPTARGQGLLHVHIANFEFMRQRHETFATFLCLSSNELFIRGGLEAYAARNPIAYQFVMFEPAIAWHMFNRGLEHDPRVRALLSDVRLPVFFGGQAEGQYFPAALFNEIAALYRRHFGAGPAGFESEEIIPQTIALAAAGEMQPIAPPSPFKITAISST